MNPTTPPAAIASANLPSSLHKQWHRLAKDRQNGPNDHAVYALLRHIHWGETDDKTDITSKAFELSALRKIVRTFTPISNQNKIFNGQKPFGALFSALDAVRTGRNCGASLQLNDKELTEVRALAQDVFARAREAGVHGLRELAVVAPKREKKPYVPA